MRKKPYFESILQNAVPECHQILLEPQLRLCVQITILLMHNIMMFGSICHQKCFVNICWLITVGDLVKTVKTNSIMNSYILAQNLVACIKKHLPFLQIGLTVTESEP